MNFVARVEENLRDLGTEARRKHPGVKEASERAILNLRRSQTEYVAAVRKATSDVTQSHPTTALFRSQETLRPFLLAANYPGASARTIDIALGGIELLLHGDAVCEGDEIHVIRVLGIQAGVCSDALSRAETSAGHSMHGMVGSGVGAAGSAAAGAVGAVIGGGLASLGMFSGERRPATDTGVSTSADPQTHGLGSRSGPSTHSTRTTLEDEAVADRVLGILVSIVKAPGLAMTEETFTQCVTVCLILLSCGSAAYNGNTPTEAAIDKIFEQYHNRLRMNSRSGQSEVGNGVGVRGSALQMEGSKAACRVRRNAAEALKNVMLALFRRTSAALDHSAESTSVHISEVSPGAMNENVIRESSDLNTIRSLAALSFGDICSVALLVSPKIGKFSKPSTLEASPGPIANALVNGAAAMGQRHGTVHPPSRATCVWIVENILSEGKDLFESVDDRSSEFSSLLKSKACTLASKSILDLISDDSPSYIGKSVDLPSDSLKARKANFAASIPNSSELALLVASTNLVRTIVSNYGSWISAESEAVISCLVCLVSKAADGIRETEDFEDGYIFDRVEHEKLSLKQGSASGNIGTFTSSTTRTSSGGSAQSTKRNGKGFPASIHNRGIGLGSALSQSRPTPISPTLLWGAALSLEALHGLVLTSFHLLAPMMASIVEALSDFTAVGGSCKHSIEGVLAAAYNDTSIDFPNKLFQFRANELVEALGEEWGVLFGYLSDDAKADRFEEAFTHSSSTSSKYSPPSSMPLFVGTGDLVGDVVWLAYKCTLSVSKALMKAPWVEVVDGTFSPSLALFQHFMKRFPGSPTLRESTVTAYTNLANVVIRGIEVTNCPQRKALLSSLCKLSIPCWGKRNNTMPMEDHHLECLDALFGIIHNYRDSLGNDWYIVLQTLEYLSSLPVSSNMLSAMTYKKATSVPSCFMRLPLFTTCLSAESFKYFIEALVQISTVQTSETAKQGDGIARFPSSRWTEDDRSIQAYKDLSSSGRWFGFAGRAFGAPSDQANLSAPEKALSRIQVSRTYAEDFYDEGYSKLAAAKPTTQRDVFASLPFSLVSIPDITLSNSFRFDKYGSTVTNHLRNIAMESLSSDIRLFAMDMLSNIVSFQLSSEISEDNSNESSLRIAAAASSINEYLCVGERADERRTGDATVKVPQAELVAPLCQAIVKTSHADTAEAGLTALHALLEGTGHHLSSDTWYPLIEAIASLSGGADIDCGIDRGITAWSTCSMLSFRCLKLIVDDFLDILPSPPDLCSAGTRSALLDCCAAFGSSQHDVNTSLTATGMLWTIADQDLTPNSLDRVLEKLSSLSFDGRVEVRNCSVNTLFSCVIGLGDRLAPEQWRVCLSEKLFGVLQQVAQLRSGDSSPIDASQSSLDNTPEIANSNRYKVTVHYSRDSATKQWASTQVLALRGLERVLRQFFPRLLRASAALSNSENWFEKAWKQGLTISYHCATLSGGRDTLDLRTAGADLLVLCSQLSSQAGIAGANSPARVGTNMQVINGALRSIAPSRQEEGTSEGSSISSELDAGAEGSRSRLFSMAFEMLENLCAELGEQAQSGEKESSPRYAESTLLQVMTKLAAGLVKLCECCKDYELKPLGNSSNGKNIESRIVASVVIVTKCAVGDFTSKYVTQAQRTCLDLLKTLSLQESLVAYRELAALGGTAYFHSTLDDIDCAGETFSFSASEVLENECATFVVDTFVDGSVHAKVKLVVFEAILESFIAIMTSKVASGIGRHRPLNYELFVPVVREGLESVIIQSDQLDAVRTDKIWERVLAALNALLVPANEVVGPSFVDNSPKLTEIMSLCIRNLPNHFDREVGIILSQGAENAAGVAQDLDGLARADAIEIFKACFEGLCVAKPQSESLLGISEKLLKDTVDGASKTATSREHDEDNSRRLEVDVEIALFVCRSLRQVPHLELVATSLFPWLCKLTRSDNASLRTEAGAVLSSVDLVGVIDRAESAEKRALAAEKDNAQLLIQIEALQTENDELKRQAVLGI